MIASLIRLSAALPVRMGVAAAARPLAFVGSQKQAASSRRALTVSAPARATATETIANTAAAAVDAVAPKKTATKVKKAASKTKKAASPKKAAAKAKASKKRAKTAPPSTLASKPKRSSPYLNFVAEKRVELGNDPDFYSTNAKGEEVYSVVKFSKRAAEMWHELAADEKDQYKQKAARENASYKKELEEWVGGMTPAEIQAHNTYVRHRRSKKKGGLARIQDPTKPKMPMTPFLRFLQENRSRLSSESGSVTEVAKKGGEEWKSIGGADKARYEDAYKADREKYDAEIQKWKASNSA